MLNILFSQFQAKPSTANEGMKRRGRGGEGERMLNGASRNFDGINLSNSRNGSRSMFNSFNGASTDTVGEVVPLTNFSFDVPTHANAVTIVRTNSLPFARMTESGKEKEKERQKQKEREKKIEKFLNQNRLLNLKRLREQMLKTTAGIRGTSKGFSNMDDDSVKRILNRTKSFNTGDEESVSSKLSTSDSFKWTKGVFSNIKEFDTEDNTDELIRDKAIMDTYGTVRLFKSNHQLSHVVSDSYNKAIRKAPGNKYSSFFLPCDNFLTMKIQSVPYLSVFVTAFFYLYISILFALSLLPLLKWTQLHVLRLIAWESGRSSP